MLQSQTLNGLRCVIGHSNICEGDFSRFHHYFLITEVM